MRIKQKTIYGGFFVDKYYLILEDDTQVQVSFKEWQSYKIGGIYKNIGGVDYAYKIIESEDQR